MKLDLSLMTTGAQRDALQASQTLSQFTAAIQSHLDTTARERHYDDIQSAITYRGDPNPVFAAEADALFNWRSAVWSYSTAELDKVKSGKRKQPTLEEFIAELPAFNWESETE